MDAQQQHALATSPGCQKCETSADPSHWCLVPQAAAAPGGHGAGAAGTARSTSTEAPAPAARGEPDAHVTRLFARQAALLPRPCSAPAHASQPSAWHWYTPLDSPALLVPQCRAQVRLAGMWLLSSGGS